MISVTALTTETDTDRHGCELLLVVAQEEFRDDGPAGQIQAREIFGTFEPVIGVVQEEAAELVDLPLVGSPLADPGGFVKPIQEVPGHEIVLVLATIEEGQGCGSLDVFGLGHGVELLLVRGHLGRVAWVRSVASCGSVSALS